MKNNAVAFSNNDVITIAWSLSKKPLGCMGFAIIHESVEHKNQKFLTIKEGR
jgi:hypothetical protein